MSERLRDTVRAPGRPFKRPTAAVAEALGLYVETRAAWDDAKIARLDWLLERLSPRELDAYYDGIGAWRRSR